MNLAYYHSKTLKDPSQPESLHNYVVCGASTKSGSSCKARAQVAFDGKCTMHGRTVKAPELRQEESILARSLKRKEQLIQEHNERLKDETFGFTEHGSQFRTDFCGSLGSTLIPIIHPRSGRFATNDYAKLAMLKDLNPDESVLVVWPGKWRSDTFIMRVSRAIAELESIK